MTKTIKSNEDIFKEFYGVFEDENDLLPEDIEESGVVTLEEIEEEVSGK